MVCAAVAICYDFHQVRSNVKTTTTTTTITTKQLVPGMKIWIRTRTYPLYLRCRWTWLYLASCLGFDFLPIFCALLATFKNHFLLHYPGVFAAVFISCSFVCAAVAICYYSHQLRSNVKTTTTTTKTKSTWYQEWNYEIVLVRTLRTYATGEIGTSTYLYIPYILGHIYIYYNIYCGTM